MTALVTWYRKMNILHVSALWLWAMDGKGGMPSLYETVAGHSRSGHEVTMIMPKYNLFSDQLEVFSCSDVNVCKLYLAECSWYPVVGRIRKTIRNLSADNEIPYFLRWVINLSIALLLTMSLFLKGLSVRSQLREPIDLVYAHNQYAALAGWLLGRVCRVPNVTRLYGTFLADLMRRPFVRLRYPVAVAGYLIPHDLLICANDGTRGDEVARQLKIDMNRFRFWQNGVEFPSETAGLSRADVTQRFAANNLRSDATLFLSCSRLSNWKRIDRIFNALAWCRKSGCSCQLLIAGDGPEREPLEKLSIELGISQRPGMAWPGFSRRCLVDDENGRCVHHCQ